MIFLPIPLYAATQSELLYPIMEEFRQNHFIFVIYIVFLSGLYSTLGYFLWSWQLVLRAFTETYKESQGLNQRLLSKRKSFGSCTEVEFGLM